MMKKVGILVILSVFAFAISANAQTKKQKKMAGYLIGNYEVECMGTGVDGTQLVKVWGFGNKPDDAVYQAKKNAIHAVMFKGIRGGKPGCMTRPLVTAPGAEQMNADYFNTFFADGGRYLNFVSQSGSQLDRIKIDKKQYKVGVVISVAHAELRRELEAAGVIKKMGAGF